jgi:glucosylceramidase
VTGGGTGQLTRIAVPDGPFRYVRILSTATAPQWWSVADLRIYS